MRKKTSNSQHKPLQVELLEARNLLAADLVRLSPADDGSTSVSDNFVLTFGEGVQAGPGLGNIVINNAADDSVVEAINVHSDRVIFDGNTVTVDPSDDLPDDAQLYVTIDTAAVRDTAADVSNTVLMAEDFEGLPLKNSDFDTALNNYVVIMSGVLDVQVAGDYTFGGNSDEGQFLFIDVVQDGIDPENRFDDEIIADNTKHGTQDRLSVCGVETVVESCVGDSVEPPITLSVGEYAFEYWYFEAGGGSGGEFFYAQGLQEEFNDEFVLVGDDSKGIGVTADGITGTTYLSAGEAIGSLDPAAIDLVEGFIDQAEGYPRSGQLLTADVHNTGGSGRFDDNHTIPGFVDPSQENFTDVPPLGWTKDNSNLPPGGPAEYDGWTFLDKDVWIHEQGDQNRTMFTEGQGVLALVDPDAYDDFVEVNSEDFVAAMSTPSIYLDGAVENTATISMASSWWDEDLQSAELRVEYFAGNGDSISNNVLFRWDSNRDSEFFRDEVDPQFDANGSGDTRNEFIENLPLNNPAGAASMVITFDMPRAGNDWWWAVDNIVVKADVVGNVYPGIADNSAWNFTTALSAALAADIDGDGTVGFLDFLALSNCFGVEVASDPNCAGADINGDGKVGFLDFLVLVRDFGKSAVAVDAVFAE